MHPELEKVFILWEEYDLEIQPDSKIECQKKSWVFTWLNMPQGIVV
jgi:hypothetical protein